MSPFLRRAAVIGASALALLVLGMVALATLKAAWAATRLLFFVAVAGGIVFALWWGRRWWRLRRSRAQPDQPTGPP